MAGPGVAVENNRLWQHVEARSPASSGHGGDGGMEQRGDAMLGDEGERFLGFS